MGVSKVKALQRRDSDDAASWGARWAQIANERLMNAARGESSPWLAIKQAAYEIPLSANERGGLLGGWGQSNQTDARQAAFDEAMKSADRQAAARAAVQAALNRGKESPEAMAKGRAFLESQPQMPSAWLEMYPQFQNKRPVLAGQR